MVNPQFFANYIAHFSYFGIFLSVSLAGYIIPLPEEVMLLLAGYIAGFGFNLYAVVLAAILGVLTGDSVLFWLSRYEGSKLVEKLKRRVDKHELNKYRNLMKEHIGKTIFILRFVVGLRFLSPFLAGSMKIKWKKFLFYNTLAAIVYVPIVVFLGYHFHNQLVALVTSFEIARHIIFLLFLAVIGILISVFLKKKFYTHGQK